MAALNDCVCQHVGYCDGSCQHPEPVSATTSAGVTEEQVEAACAKYAWARYGGTVVWPRDFSPKEISEGRENMRAALEASRVAPASQKEAVPEFGLVAKQKLNSLLADGWAVNGYALIKGEERRGFIDFGGFVGWWLPEYYHSHTSDISPAPAGEPGISERLYDPDEPMADGQIRMTAAENVLGWLLIEKIGVPDDRNYSPNEAQEILVRRLDYANEMENERIRSALVHPTPSKEVSFQERVQPWLIACFGEEIASDKVERNHRFLEEALELVQSGGCTASEAHQLVDYVFGRDVGDIAQEVGGVMNTLAALCLAHGLDMHGAGDVELARVWTKVEQIRAKQKAKPKHSPLPVHPAPTPVSAHPDDLAVDRFATAMKAKLAKKREEGRGGWDGPTCSAEILSQMLRKHVMKGDPVDVANLAMMLQQRGEGIVSGESVELAQQVLDFFKAARVEGLYIGAGKNCRLPDNEDAQYGPLAKALLANATAIRSALPTPVSAPVGVSGWQPIQIAPKDGTWIEAWRGSAPTGVWSNPVYVRWCQFDDGEGAWCWPDYTYDVTSDDARDSADTHVLNGDSYEDAVNFTDWRPLPAAPARSPAMEGK